MKWRNGGLIRWKVSYPRLEITSEANTKRIGLLLPARFGLSVQEYFNLYEPEYLVSRMRDYGFHIIKYLSLNPNAPPSNMHWRRKGQLVVVDAGVERRATDAEHIKYLWQ